MLDVSFSSVAPVPLPAPGWLLLSGRGGLILRRRQAKCCHRLRPKSRQYWERLGAPIDQALRLFSHAERHLLSSAGRLAQRFERESTPLQRQVLDLLGMPASAFRG